MKILCKKCGVNEVKEVNKYCDDCKKIEREIYHYKKKKYKELGLCVKCGKPNKSKFVHCAKCRKKQRNYQIASELRRLKENKCVLCGNALDNETHKCNNCRDKQKAYMKIYNIKRIQKSIKEGINNEN